MFKTWISSRILLLKSSEFSSSFKKYRIYTKMVFRKFAQNFGTSPRENPIFFLKLIPKMLRCYSHNLPMFPHRTHHPISFNRKQFLEPSSGWHPQTARLGRPPQSEPGKKTASWIPQNSPCLKQEIHLPNPSIFGKIPPKTNMTWGKTAIWRCISY